eukprot:365540-Chlamydomonas_euryale.AAC.10
MPLNIPCTAGHAVRRAAHACMLGMPWSMTRRSSRRPALDRSSCNAVAAAFYPLQRLPFSAGRSSDCG